MAFTLALGTATSGCDDPQKPAAISTAPFDVVTPDAAPVAPAPSATPLAGPDASLPSSASIDVALAVDSSDADAGAEELIVSLRSPDLGLDLPVHRLKFPYVCRSIAAKSLTNMRVSCTPNFRGWVAKATLKDGALHVTSMDSKGQGRNVIRPVPEGRTLRFVDQEVSPRSLPSAACPEGSLEHRPIELKFIATTVSLPERRTNTLALRVLSGKGIVPLIDELGWWNGCQAHQLGDDVEIHCRGDRHFASFRPDGASVLIEWRERNAEPFAGRLLVPCNAQPKIKAPKNFVGYSNYR